MASKLVCVWLINMVVIAATIGSEGAISCGQVVSALRPCISYLQGKVKTVPPPCCSGVKAIKKAAKTTDDRQFACKCIKSAAGSISGINYKLAGGLPGKCDVDIPYKISPTTDCSKVK